MALSARAPAAYLARTTPAGLEKGDLGFGTIGSSAVLAPLLLIFATYSAFARRRFQQGQA